MNEHEDFPDIGLNDNEVACSTTGLTYNKGLPECPLHFDGSTPCGDSR